jgi:transcriptional regulator GlxA family with amidase domain
MDVEVLLFDGFDELDAVGPYEVLASAGAFGATVAVTTVTNEAVERVTASHGLVVEPDGVLGDPDLLVVPGGGWTGGGVRREYDAGTLPAAIAARHEAGTAVASVCTGAMLLAAGGVLDGRPATTHHVAHADLEAVTERIDARVVDDGDVITAGGVTSGIDLALWLVEREFGRDIAESVALELEYERRDDVHRA